MSRNILIAEDNLELSDMMRNYLMRAGYTVYQAFDGDQALNLACSLRPDLMLLDIMMPKKDGFEVCREVRKRMRIPIIVTTAKATEEDKESMFELGADDYLTKPFSLKEAVMRVNAQIRRCYEFGTAITAGEERHLGTLTIRPERFEAEVEGAPLSLSAKEFKLLDVLTSEPDRIYTKSMLLDKVWGTEDYIDENTLAVTVARLREKLAASGVSNIVTVWGLGYKWQS